MHETQEWHDLYQEATNDEMQLFFDRYLKNVDNAWDATPHVRISLLGFNQPNVRNHPFAAWPVPETKYRTLYLGSEERMHPEPFSQFGFVSYKSDVISEQLDNDSEELHFKFRIPRRTYLLGSVRAFLRVSCDELDDMDIFLQVRKADTEGNVLMSYNVPIHEMEREGIPRNRIPMLNTFVYLGPHGQIRASHRAIDQKLSKPHTILHDHTAEERIPLGSMTTVETSIWPGGIIFEKGETLILKISGHPMYLAEFPTLRGEFKARNKGMHKVHFGGSEGSHVVVPFVESG